MSAQRRSLRRRLYTLTVSWLALCGAVLAGIAILALDHVRNHIEQEHSRLARTLAGGVDRAVSTASEELGLLAEDLHGERADVPRLLRAFRFRSAFRQSLFVLDAAGRTIAAEPAGTDRPLELPREPVLVGVVLDEGDVRRSSIVFTRSFVRDGERCRLVGRMTPGDSVLDRLLAGPVEEVGLHGVIVDADGVVIAAGSTDRLFLRLPAAFAARIEPGRRTVFVSETCPVCPESSRAGRALIAVAPLEQAPWAVIVVHHADHAFAPYAALRRAALLAGGTLGALGILLSAALSRSVVVPLRELSRRAERLRGGDLSTPFASEGDAEIATLATTLESARARLASTLGELGALNRELEQRVEQRTRRLHEQDLERRKLVRRMLAATEEERRRIARELHDEIAQLLTVVQLAVDRVGVADPAVDEARRLLTEAQREIHRIIHNLRPTLLDDLGLAAAIVSHAESHLAGAGLRVHFEIEPGLVSRPDIDVTIFRIFQEIATNILRHAAAAEVSIELYESEGKRVLAVEDDGAGFVPDRKYSGAGLVGMRERAEIVRGTIRWDSEPGAGTHVKLEIPVEP